MAHVEPGDTRDCLDEEVGRLKGGGRPDGTDRLLTVLYGHSGSGTIRHALGGSEARMLHDAADEILKLRAQIEMHCRRIALQSDALSRQAEKR